MCEQLFAELPNVKLYDNPVCCSRAVTYRQTGRYGETSDPFSVNIYERVQLNTYEYPRNNIHKIGCNVAVQNLTVQGLQVGFLIAVISRAPQLPAVVTQNF
jgi:hypothetical protein